MSWKRTSGSFRRIRLGKSQIALQKFEFYTYI